MTLQGWSGKLKLYVGKPRILFLLAAVQVENWNDDLWKENNKVTILIDADGCPVVDLTIQTAAKYKVPVLILCDTAHQIQRDGAQTLTFGKGADSVDFALVNRVHPGDLVITQDYGLASMCLARRARVLNQNGLEYTPENIDGLLFRRHENKKLLRAGKHPKGAIQTNEGAGHGL